MKMESQKRHEHMLFLATENVIVHVNQPYKIRQDMIESKNFIPEAFLMHQFHDSKNFGILSLTERLGEGNEHGLLTGFSTPYDAFSAGATRREEISYLSDEEDDDFDDEDEEWDDEDEEWDDEDEEWDDEDEEWDDEDEDLDEDEDWSDDEEE